MQWTALPPLMLNVGPLNEGKDQDMLWLMRTRVAFSLACMLFAAAAAGQTQPDFSGRWVLINPGDAVANVARTLVVQQPIVSTNVFGSPMPPAFLTITIERHFVDDIRTDMYHIGVEGGGFSREAAPNAPVSQTRFSVRWDADRLVIDTGRYSGPTREAGPYIERSKIWQLDPAGTLRVTTSDRGSAISPTSTTAMYRRE